MSGANTNPSQIRLNSYFHLWHGLVNVVAIAVIFGFWGIDSVMDLPPAAVDGGRISSATRTMKRRPRRAVPYDDTAVADAAVARVCSGVMYR